MTLELLRQEEQGTTATPTYLSRDEYKIAATPRKERNPSRSTPYAPPQKISIPQDTKWDKKIHPNYKPQNVILNKKYACLLEVRRGLLQGREARHINTPAEKSIKLFSEIPKQGLVKKDDNKDDETKEVEDTDKKDQDDINNHNLNINCK